MQATGVWLILLLAAPGPLPGPAPARPTVALVVGAGEGSATPVKQRFSGAGGGNIMVAHPAPDTLVVTMTGAVVAAGHPFKATAASYDFELSQCFEVVSSAPLARPAKLTIEGRVVGVLRTSCKGCGSHGSAGISVPAHAAITCGTQTIASLALPPRSASSGQDRSVYNREGPVRVPVMPGKHVLRQVFGIAVSQPPSPGLCKGVSAEFAPDPALDAKWLSYWEPFRGANKKEFGFQVIIKVEAE